jgi:hypothetical protein
VILKGITFEVLTDKDKTKIMFIILYS